MISIETTTIKKSAYICQCQNFYLWINKKDKYKPIKPKFVVIKNLLCLPLLRTNGNLGIKLYFCKYIFDEL